MRAVQILRQLGAGAVLFCSVSCGSEGGSEDGSSNIAELLPPLSELRSGSSTVDHFQNGSEPERMSPGFAAEGNSGRLDASTASSFQYAIFSFDPGDEPLIEVLATLGDLGAGDSAYLARSDYSTGRWQISGPHSSAQLPLDITLPLESASHLSDDNRVYCAVIAPQGSNLLLDSVSFRSEGNIPPVAILTANLLSGDPGLDVDFSGAQSYDPDGDIVSYQWDLNGDGLLEDNTGAVPASDYTFNATGYYLARLRVTDNQGLSSSSEPLGIVVHGSITRSLLDPNSVPGDFSLLVIDGRPRMVFIDNDELIYGESDSALGTGIGDWDFIALETPFPVDMNFTSLAEVEGRPALVCNSENTDGDPVLLYARSPSGSALQPDNWYFRDIDTTSIGSYCGALAVVAGCPAVIYEDTDNGNTIYSRSSTATGEGPVWLRLEVLPGQNLEVTEPSLMLIGGNPAFIYRSSPGEDLMYARSSTPDGMLLEDWTSTLLVSAYSIADASMCLIDGHPAITYHADSVHNVRYHWSTTPLGLVQGEWMDVEVESLGVLGNNCRLIESQDRPVVAYNRSDADTINIARSSTEHGTDPDDWDDIIVASGLDDPAQEFDFAAVSGLPALAYYDSVSGQVKYAMYF